MPYIKREDRPALDVPIAELVQRIKDQGGESGESPECLEHAGRATYSITRFLLDLFPRKKYWIMALVVGILATCVLEYYRKWVAPYEDEKINDNGDVY